MSLIIDTHAHLNFKDYEEDAEEVIKRALENNVWFINVGTELKTSQRAIDYAEKYSQGVFAAVGFHPLYLKIEKFKGKNIENNENTEFEVENEEFDYEKYKNLAKSSQKVVAIGETGLDYYRISNLKSEILKIQIEKQKEVFKKQIDLAFELNKALIIHCREAHRDLIEVLQSIANNNQKLLFRGVIHSFSGNCKQAREYRRLGFKIAFNGIITFARDYDKVILDTPLEDILLETDCPYLTPVPYRGQRNEPLYVVEVAKKIAEIKNLSLERVIEQTTLNAKRVFGIL